MSNVIELEQRQDDYNGLCPVCHKTDGYMNVGKTHYFYCREHKTMWCVGRNLFSSWQHEPEELWEKNARFLETCRRVDPFLWPQEKTAGLAMEAEHDDLPF